MFGKVLTGGLLATTNKWESLISKHIGVALEKQSHFLDVHEKLGFPDWFFDIPGKGKLEFGPDVEYDVKIIGSDSQSVNTFLWGWAGDASIPKHLLCTELKDHPELHDVADIFQCPDEIPLTPTLNGHAISLVASSILDAKAMFPGPYGGGVFYTLIVDEKFPSLEEKLKSCTKIERLSNVIPLMTRAPFVPNHKEAFLSFADTIGLKTTTASDEAESATVIETLDESTGDNIVTAFDSVSGRMTQFMDETIPSLEELQAAQGGMEDRNKCMQLTFDFSQMMMGGLENAKASFKSFAESIGLIVKEWKDGKTVEALDEERGEAVVATFDDLNRCTGLQSVYKGPGADGSPPDFEQLAPPSPEDFANQQYMYLTDESMDKQTRIRVALSGLLVDPKAKDHRASMRSFADTVGMIIVEDPGGKTLIALDEETSESVTVDFNEDGEIHKIH